MPSSKDEKIQRLIRDYENDLLQLEDRQADLRAFQRDIEDLVNEVRSDDMRMRDEDAWAFGPGSAVAATLGDWAPEVLTAFVREGDQAIERAELEVRTAAREIEARHERHARDMRAALSEEGRGDS